MYESELHNLSNIILIIGCFGNPVKYRYKVESHLYLCELFDFGKHMMC